MPARNQPWVRDIIRQKSHILRHVTSRENALSILKSKTIHGAYRSNKNGEGFPHFIYDGWNAGLNYLPHGNEVTLFFQSNLPARYRGEGNKLPEAGFLEIYSLISNPHRPWQCSIHPESEPLIFISAENWEPNTKWHDGFPIGRSLDAKLKIETYKASKEKRKIRANFWM